jgi:hypothetical protein
MHIFVLKPRHRKVPKAQLQWHCQGHSVAVPHNPAAALAAKYPRPQDYVDMLKFFWVGDKLPPKDQLKKWANVSRQKLMKVDAAWREKCPVRAAMPPPNFSSFPEDDIPEEIWNTIDLTSESDFKMPVVPGAPAHAPGVDIIRSLGVIDMEGKSSLSLKEIDAAAISNLEATTKKKRTNKKRMEVVVSAEMDKPVVEYENPMLFYGAFPALFQRELGGPECNLRNQYGQKLTLDKWFVRALSICDHRFRYHLTFIFVVDNILHRRNVCLQARMATKKPWFNSAAAQISTLQSSDFSDDVSL